MQDTFLSRFSFILGLIAAFCTAAYSTRLLYLVFVRKNKVSVQYLNNYVHDVDYIILIPLTVLIFGSVFSGVFLKNIFEFTQTDFFKQTIFVNPNNIQPLTIYYVPPVIK